MTRYLLFILTLLLLPIPVLAQTKPQTTDAKILEQAKARAAEEAYEKKLQQQKLGYQDSIDYMLDDGKMSKEEMKKEAEYIYGLCAYNAFQKIYFDCRCLAGAFLAERERLGPTAIQSDIMQRLTQSSKAKCGNTETIAGRTYESCMTYSRAFRELATDHEDMCRCAANRVATNFQKKPILDPSYVASLNAQALSHCINPQKRNADEMARRARQDQNNQFIKMTNP